MSEIIQEKKYSFHCKCDKCSKLLLKDLIKYECLINKATEQENKRCAGVARKHNNEDEHYGEKCGDIIANAMES